MKGKKTEDRITEWQKLRNGKIQKRQKLWNSE